MTSSNMQELHSKGECRPCAYFYKKADSCRQGDDCVFCHLCPQDALKTKRKEKLKAVKQHIREQRFAQYASWTILSNVPWFGEQDSAKKPTPLSSKSEPFVPSKFVPDVISPRPSSDSSEPEPSPVSSVNGEDSFTLAMPISPPPGLELPTCEYQGSSGSEPECEQGSQHLSEESIPESDMQHAREVAAAGGGLSGHITVMMRHVPWKYTQGKLMNEINSAGFLDTYDFFYLPLDMRNPGNRGFAFINFLSPQLAEEFYSKYHGQKLKHFEATAPIAVMPADVQGFEESANRFFTAGLRKKTNQGEPVFLKPLKLNLGEEGGCEGQPIAHDLQSAVQKKTSKKSKRSTNAAYNAPWQVEAPYMPFDQDPTLLWEAPIPCGMPPSTMTPLFCGTCGNLRIAGHNFCQYCGDLLY